MFFERGWGFRSSPAPPTIRRLICTSLFPVHLTLLSYPACWLHFAALFSVVETYEVLYNLRCFWESEFHYRRCKSSSVLQFMDLCWFVVRRDLLLDDKIQTMAVHVVFKLLRSLCGRSPQAQSTCIPSLWIAGSQNYFLAIPRCPWSSHRCIRLGHWEKIYTAGFVLFQKGRDNLLPNQIFSLFLEFLLKAAKNIV